MTDLLPSTGKATSFAAFVDRVNDPVNSGITANLKEIIRVEAK